MEACTIRDNHDLSCCMKRKVMSPSSKTSVHPSQTPQIRAHASHHNASRFHLSRVPQNSNVVMLQSIDLFSKPVPLISRVHGN
jgi:hypothetical protein